MKDETWPMWYDDSTLNGLINNDNPARCKKRPVFCPNETVVPECELSADHAGLHRRGYIFWCCFPESDVLAQIVHDERTHGVYFYRPQNTAWSIGDRE